MTLVEWLLSSIACMRLGWVGILFHWRHLEDSSELTSLVGLVYMHGTFVALQPAA